MSKDEDARRLKLKSHLLRDSKESLQDQLSAKDELISKMAAKYEQTVSELQVVKETVRKQGAQIKSQTRDFTHLQVCVTSIQLGGVGDMQIVKDSYANSPLRQNYNPSNRYPKTPPSS